MKVAFILIMTLSVMTLSALLAGAVTVHRSFRNGYPSGAQVCASGIYEKGEILKTKFPSVAYKLGLKVK